LDDEIQDRSLKADQRNGARHPFDPHRADFNRSAIRQSFDDRDYTFVGKVDVAEGLIDMSYTWPATKVTGSRIPLIPFSDSVGSARRSRLVIPSLF
jgi:hypothetical protein